MLENYEDIFNKVDFNEFNKFWLHNNQYIINQYKRYDNNLYKNCSELIDLFCIQILREIVYCFSEEIEFDLENMIYKFLWIINTLEIDFNLFILLCGEEYINSDMYEYTDDFETNQFNIIMYIIYKNFTDILSILKKHYINDDNLLLNILDGMEFKDRYLEVIENIIDFEDIYDYVDVVKLYQWKEDGFPICGE